MVEQQRRMQELEGKKMKMQEEMAARAANSTEQERQTMIAHHEEKLVQPEVKTCKDSEDDMLRQKLEARKKKKQALQKRKQQEEVNEAALAGGDAEAEVKKRVKAAALQELQQMVLTDDLQGAVRLLRQAHEKSELRTAHSPELASLRWLLCQMAPMLPTRNARSIRSMRPSLQISPPINCRSKRFLKRAPPWRRNRRRRWRQGCSLKRKKT